MNSQWPTPYMCLSCLEIQRQGVEVKVYKPALHSGSTVCFWIHGLRSRKNIIQVPQPDQYLFTSFPWLVSAISGCWGGQDQAYLRCCLEWQIACRHSCQCSHLKHGHLSKALLGLPVTIDVELKPKTKQCYHNGILRSRWKVGSEWRFNTEVGNWELTKNEVGNEYTRNGHEACPVKSTPEPVFWDMRKEQVWHNGKNRPYQYSGSNLKFKKLLFTKMSVDQETALYITLTISAYA